MVCPKCGHANPDIAQFCGKCGVALPVGGGAAAPQPPVSTRTPRATPQGISRGSKTRVVIGALVITIVALVIGIIYVSGARSEKQGPDLVASLRPSLEAAIQAGDMAEIQASRQVDEHYLYTVYAGKRLQEERAVVEELRDSNWFAVLDLEGQAFDSFSVNPEGTRAAVRLVETWSGTYYSTVNQKCVARLPRDRVPQTIFLGRTPTGWMIDSITFHTEGASRVACS